MRILAGTSGWQYKEWKGTFYPDDMSPADMLTFYAGEFPAVEVNNTFYRMPKTSVLEGWAASVPDGFSFVLKASRRITHFARLKEEATEPLKYLLDTASVLGDRLGPVLFQLPPNMKKDLPRLNGFLDQIPEGTRAAFEFRNDTWYDADVMDTLQAHDVALCVANTAEEETPFTSTASYGYLRLRKEAYEEGELELWADRIKAQSWSDVHVFFKHEDEGTGPRLAKRFMKICE